MVRLFKLLNKGSFSSKLESVNDFIYFRLSRKYFSSLENFKVKCLRFGKLKLNCKGMGGFSIVKSKLSEFTILNLNNILINLDIVIV
jgi:hypothetical protein